MDSSQQEGPDEKHSHIESEDRNDTFQNDRNNERMNRARTGITGLDDVLDGGLQRNHTYLVEGLPGSGKTTLGLQFSMEGMRQSERVLYLATSESDEEIRQIARSHGWTLNGITIHHYDARESLGKELEQSVFHPAEVELPRTIETLRSVIDRVNPQRLVIDSLSEIRLLASDPLWFRRQVLALKEYLSSRNCTTLLCDLLQDPGQPVYTIVHGVLTMEHRAPEYGPDRRRLRVSKLRGQSYSSGYHDYKIHTGGIEVYPRLVASEHRRRFQPEAIPSGLPALDSMFGGGADRGTATLLFGPSGTGKSSIACKYVAAAADRGEASAMYIFDERVQTLLSRMEGMGIDLEGYIDGGMVNIRQIDPAELTPGELSHSIRQDVAERGVRLVVIDSLAGYFQAMPNEQLLALHLHELLSYLSQQGVSILLVMTQHGFLSNQRYTPIDISYVSDSVLQFHLFEYAGELRRAISVYKRRSGNHERTIRELQFGPKGIMIGAPLTAFHGILTGIPRHNGGTLADD